MTVAPSVPGPLVLALDASTTATKALVVDVAGNVLAQGRAVYGLTSPGTSFYEQEARDWVGATHIAARQAIGKLEGDDRRRLAAVSITPQRQTFVPCAADGRPLRSAILWLDGRASEQVLRLGSERVHELSGMVPDVTPSFYKLAWLAEHEPEVLERADKIATVHGYLTFALTGQWLDSRATADSLGLFDMAARTWSDELLSLCSVRPGQMLGLREVGDPMALLLPEVARQWGLSETIPVVAGCGDGQAAGLGAGVTEPDEGYLNLGTAVVAGVHSAEYRWGQSYRTDAAGIPGHYVLEVVQNSGAFLAGWFRTELGDPALQGAPDPALEAEAAAVSPGSGGLLTLPYWNAVQSPHWDPLARGAMVGFTGTHSRAALYRSVLEGISLETGRNLKALERDTGMPLRMLRIMGGGQRSPLWRQILAACVGVPLEACATEEVSALGAAVIAMSAVTGEGMPTLARAMTRVGERTEPDPELVERYAEISDVQSELYERLAPMFPRLDALSQADGGVSGSE